MNIIDNDVPAHISGNGERPVIGTGHPGRSLEKCNEPQKADF